MQVSITDTDLLKAELMPKLFYLPAQFEVISLLVECCHVPSVYNSRSEGQTVSENAYTIRSMDLIVGYTINYVDYKITINTL